MPEKLDLGNGELAFFNVEVKAIFSNSLKDSIQATVVFFLGLASDENISR